MSSKGKNPYFIRFAFCDKLCVVVWIKFGTCKNKLLVKQIKNLKSQGRLILDKMI